MSLDNINITNTNNAFTRLEKAKKTLAQLNALGIHLLPVRHHSPACAYATLRALQSVQPAHVLIEAPANCNELLPDLQHLDSRPPLAVLCQTTITFEGEKRLCSAYVPFCDYSPEWVALRFGQDSETGHLYNSKTPSVEFIDLPWLQHVAHRQTVLATKTWETETLQQERYLAHSCYVEALASKLHCRHHDEVWEHLFELDSVKTQQDWQGFFERVLVWCAMSRLDYENSVLEAESSVVREQFMLSKILSCYQQKQESDDNIIVVTGGFHTLALIESLGDVLLNQQSAPKVLSTYGKNDEAWLIRYSFDRLDALNGYASGMPSPAFYQKVWENSLANEPPTQAHIDFLSHFSHVLRQKNILQSNFTHIKTACEQAIGIAQLRGHSQIGRYDLLDACQTAFIKDSNDTGYEEFYALLHEKLRGSRLGEVVQTTRIPPLLAQVQRLLSQHYFKLDDTIRKQTKLDILRKASHQKRSHLLHLLRFLDVGFAEHHQGPDFLHGTQLHLLFETWEYAWTPAVEAQLIQLSEDSNDVYQFATKRLLEKRNTFAETGEGYSSARAIQLLIQAATMGLQTQLVPLCDAVKSILPHDPQLSSVIACGQHLIYLWVGRKFLPIFQTQQELIALLKDIPNTAFFLLSQAQTPSIEQVDELLQNTLSLRNLIKQIAPIIKPSDEELKNLTNDIENNLLDDFHQTLQRLLPYWQSIDLLLGAVHTLEFIDGYCDDVVLAQRLQRHFGAGAEPLDAINYLSGMMQCEPTIFLHYPIIIESLNTLISQWDEETFVSILPDMRLIFTAFKPNQTLQLGKQVSQINNVPSLSLELDSELSEGDMLTGVKVNQQVQQLLEERGLLAWFTNQIQRQITEDLSNE